MNMCKSPKKITQVLKSNIIQSQVNAMLKHFEVYNFLCKDKNNKMEFDFNSANLKRFVKNEWLFSNSGMSDHPVFSFESLNKNDKFKRAFVNVKNLVPQLPFSFIEVTHHHDTSSHQTLNNSVEIVRKGFQQESETILRNHTFCAPHNGREYFYKLQREHKIWWRKFSALPSRFISSEICTNDRNKDQYVEIKAEFPWGVETVEVIKYKPEALHYDANSFEVQHRKKTCLPQMITCETSVEKAAFTYLCDSFEKLNKDGVGEMLRFSKKLAPYKVAFAATKNQDFSQNFSDLALLLAKKIENCGISVFMLPDFFTIDTEYQITRNDALGIPYTIILSEQTLKDGIIRLRNRDTTLREQSHVSLIVPYIVNLMKN